MNKGEQLVFDKYMDLGQHKYRKEHPRKYQ